MKKRMAAGMLCMMMAAAMAVPAGAAEPQEKSTTLTTAVESEYILTIPRDMEIAFGAEETGIGSVKVTGNVKPGETVQVDADAGSFISQEDPQDTIALTLTDKSKDITFQSSVWNEQDMRSETKEIPLAVRVEKADWDKAYAGTYKAILTFEASLITAPTP